MSPRGLRHDSIVPGASSKQIIIVEDNLLFRDMLVQLIENEPGLRVCGQADNVADALTLIGQTRPDAAIVDLTLNGSSGLDLISDLTARSVQLPVLVLSLHRKSLYAERAFRAGALGYVSKQESPEEVVAALRSVMAGRVHVSEHIQASLDQLEPSEQGQAPPGVDLLSDREREVYQLVGRGLTAHEISTLLQLEPATVDSCRATIQDKLAIHNATGLAQNAAQRVEDRGV